MSPRGDKSTAEKPDCPPKRGQTGTGSSQQLRTPALRLGQDSPWGAVMILGFTLERPAARTPSRQAHRAARRATRDLLAIFSASASRDPELVKLTAASGALYNGEGEPMNCTEAWPSISFFKRLCWCWSLQALLEFLGPPVFQPRFWEGKVGV